MKAYIEEAQAALKQHGGRITGKAEAFARFLVASSGKTRRNAQQAWPHPPPHGLRVRREARQMDAGTVVNVLVAMSDN